MLTTLFFQVYGTTVLSMTPCYDKMYRLSTLQICMFVIFILSVFFAGNAGIMTTTDFSDTDDWFVFRSLIITSLFYVVTHAVSAALLSLFVVAEYLPLMEGYNQFERVPDGVECSTDLIA